MHNQVNNIEGEFIKKQKEICRKYTAEYFETSFDKLIGVALKSFDKFEMPINGLRHPIENDQSANWYIWAGEYSDADDFFSPVHVSHLLEICPKALHYLGLGPGWRFLFDSEYEDVWFDENLILKA